MLNVHKNLERDCLFIKGFIFLYHTKKVKFELLYCWECIRTKHNQEVLVEFQLKKSMCRGYIDPSRVEVKVDRFFANLIEKPRPLTDK